MKNTLRSAAVLVLLAAPAMAQRDPRFRTREQPRGQTRVESPDPRDRAIQERQREAAARFAEPDKEATRPVRGEQAPVNEDPDDARWRERAERAAQQGEAPDLSEAMERMRESLQRRKDAAAPGDGDDRIDRTGRAPRSKEASSKPRATEGGPCAWP